MWTKQNYMDFITEVKEEMNAPDYGITYDLEIFDRCDLGTLVLYASVEGLQMVFNYRGSTDQPYFYFEAIRERRYR